MMDIITWFGIILTGLGIIIAIFALIFTIRDFVLLQKLEKRQNELNSIKNILISLAVHYGPNNEKLSGEQCVKSVMKTLECDEYQALKILFTEDITIKINDEEDSN